MEVKYFTFVLLSLYLFWTISPVCPKWCQNFGVILQLVFFSLLSMEITNFSEELKFIKVISIALFFAYFDRGFSAIA